MISISRGNESPSQEEVREDHESGPCLYSMTSTDVCNGNRYADNTLSAPPSQLYSALKSTERQVIVRGSSAASPTTPSTAAISILESPLPLPRSISSTTSSILATSPSTPPPSLPGMNEEEHSQKVFGICRFVQIAPQTILMDLTVRLPPPSDVGLNPAKSAWHVYISTTGNMIDPPQTTGKPIMSLGRIEPDKDGYGDLFQEVKGELWQWVGRGCVVEADSTTSSSPPKAGENGASSGIGRIFAGVVARSAGVWGNEKTVCACSGRTMWEEGRDMEKRSML